MEEQRLLHSRRHLGQASLTPTLWVHGALKWLSKESLGNVFSHYIKALTFIEHLLCALTVTGKGQHTVGLNRINNCFVRKKTSTCLETVERE